MTFRDVSPEGQETEQGEIVTTTKKQVRTPEERLRLKKAWAIKLFDFNKVKSLLQNRKSKEEVVKELAPGRNMSHYYHWRALLTDDQKVELSTIERSFKVAKSRPPRRRMKGKFKYLETPDDCILPIGINNAS